MHGSVSVVGRVEGMGAVYLGAAGDPSSSTASGPSTWRACNTCGTPAPRSLFARDGFHIVGCRACGLVYVGEDPAGIDFDALYDERYYTGGHEGVFADYMGQAPARRASARRRLWALAPLHWHARRQAAWAKRTPRLLDVGCAAGFFIAEAAEHPLCRYTVQGVELSRYAAAFAQERMGLPVFNGTLAQAALPAGHFDVVTLWDVIEHVDDPAAVLAEVARVLAPGGRVVLTTGDIGSVYAQARGADWHLMTPPWHLYYFDRATLAATAQRAGLQVLGVRSQGVGGDGRWSRSRPGLLWDRLRDRGDIMQVTLGHATQDAPIGPTAPIHQGHGEAGRGA
jgi:SAM-dependent methyltransferase